MRIPRPHASIYTLRTVKEVVVYLGIPLLIIMSIHANNVAAKNTKATNRVVTQQTQILNAIQRATEDNRLTAEQKANLIICMLQVPQAERTTNVLESCRSAAVTSQGTQLIIPHADGSTGTITNTTLNTPPSQSQTQNNTTPPAQEQPTATGLVPTLTQTIQPVCKVLGLAC